jgi:diguanylate cyclase (GGDEF)-like protein/PAS domain S-box-containing protein
MSEEPRAEAGAPGVPGPDILVADDDGASRLLVRAALEQLGLGVVEAETGAEAVRVFLEHQPLLVVLDVLMPEMNGFEACAAIRRSPQGESTPILLLTSLDDVPSIQQAFEAGATDFAVKPLNWIVLGQRVKYMLRARQAMDDLRTSQARLSRAQQIARIGYWERDLQTGTVHWSPEVSGLFGLGRAHRTLSEDEILARIHPDDREAVRTSIGAGRTDGAYSIEFRVPTQDGMRFLREEGAGLPAPSGEPSVRMAGITQDVSRDKHAEQRIHFLTHYDALTQLPNRTLFLEQVRIALAAARVQGQLLAMLAVDVDQFRHVNDALGHPAGDRLLQEAAHRLRTVCRASDLITHDDRAPGRACIGRAGGDRFMVCLGGLRREEDVARIARRLLKAVAEPFCIESRHINVTGSIGVSLFPNDGADEEALFTRANLAMHAAKDAGGNAYQFYAGRMNETVQQRLVLENALHLALDRNEFFLHFQPQIDVVTDRVVGVEALLRWQHPELGLVPPGRFIPIAEESSLILPIGAWVLRAACAQRQAWEAAGYGPFRVAVNVSARHLLSGQLVSAVEQILQEIPLPPDSLELEITEGVLIQETDQVLSTLTALERVGVRLALDDFGTGYSSLAYLARFPFDVLKIDRAFVQPIATDRTAEAIVSAILAMAQSLGMETIAEGVETADQLHCLTAKGCRIIQGYLLGRPAPGDLLLGRLPSRSPAASALA